jgi:peptidoglycan hydrolase-like protein with peptidoglycan-binding domain
MATGKHKSSVPGNMRGRRVDGKRSQESMERRKTKKAAAKKPKSTATKPVAAAPQKPVNWPLIAGAAAVLGAAAIAATKAFGSEGESKAPAPDESQVQVSQSAQAVQDTLASAVRYGSTALTRDQTMRVQRQLTQLGFAPGPSDGVYGPRTASAVQQYQRARGLTADGAAGPITQAQLNKDAPMSAAVSSLTSGSAQARPMLAPAASTAVAATPTREATSFNVNAAVAWGRKNLTRDSVVKLQIALNDVAVFTTIRVDGDYGPETAREVAYFQLRNNLTVDGMAGRNTLAMLFPGAQVTTQSKAQLAGPHYGRSNAVSYGLGACGCDVKRVTRTYVLDR